MAEVAGPGEEGSEGTRLSDRCPCLAVVLAPEQLRELSSTRSWQVGAEVANLEKVEHMNIFVGNLPLEMTEDELRQEFAAFGQVMYVSVMSDKYIGSGQPRGYGFVEMPSKSEGAVAVAGLNGRTIRGRLIEVVEALPLSHSRDKRPFRGRGGGHLSARRQRRHQE